MFSKKATKIEEIFTSDLTLCSKRQIDGEDFVIFRGFLENMNFKFRYIFHFEQVKLVGFPIHYVLTHCTNSLSAIIAAKKPAGMLWADFHLFEQLTSFPTCRCFYLIVFSLLAPCSSLLDATTYGWVIVIFFFPMLKRCYWLLHVCWTLVNQRKFLSF